MGEHLRAGDLDIWTEQVGEGPDILLIGGLGDTVESWQFQLDGLQDRYRLTAFDNRGAGRTAMPEGPVSVEAMADDAAGVLRGLEVSSAHVAGFSGGSIIAQELAIRHPDLVRSLVLQSTWSVPDPYLRSWGLFVRGLAEVAPSERAVPRVVLSLDLHTACAQRRHRRPDHRRGARLPAQADDRGPAALPGRLPRARHDGAPAGNRRSDAGPCRRPGYDESPRAVPRRRRADPRRSVRGDGGGGAPAVPGGAGRVEYPRGRLLA
jgi:pimeloyl-ACP methyl ester carboxylesterase